MSFAPMGLTVPLQTRSQLTVDDIDRRLERKHVDGTKHGFKLFGQAR